jgi:glycosyltransferase involved in cell wall biosynthesis
MMSFVVLAYNEEANVEATIETVLRAARQSGLEGFEIIAINDGSTDRTSAVLDRLAGRYPQLRIVTNEVNLGVGASVLRGLAVASCERMMIVPGDNDMSFEMMRLLLSYRDTADLVLAFPINTEERTLGRNVLSVFYRLIHVVAFRIFVNYVNAPSIYPTALLKSVPLRSQRYSIIAEATVKLLRSGCSFAEVPGFVQNPNRGRVRRTVTLRNLREVVASFLRLYGEIHVFDRARYDRTPRRVFIDFAGSTIGSPVATRPMTAIADRQHEAGETHDARV